MGYVDPDGRPKIGNAQCLATHPLWLVSEGYAYCVAELWFDKVVVSRLFSAWRLTPPPNPRETKRWKAYQLSDGTRAWVTWSDYETLEEVLDVIQTDMNTSAPMLTPAPTYSEWLATVS